jgi:hypothetical protein
MIGPNHAGQCQCLALVIELNFYTTGMADSTHTVQATECS